MYCSQKILQNFVAFSEYMNFKLPSNHFLKTLEKTYSKTSGIISKPFQSWKCVYDKIFWTRYIQSSVNYSAVDSFSNPEVLAEITNLR